MLCCPAPPAVLRPAPPSRAARPGVSADAVRELHASLLSARRHAQLQMLAMQEIERQHGRAPLAVLAELAVEGVLASPSTRDETAP